METYNIMKMKDLATQLQNLYKNFKNIEDLPTRNSTDTINYLDYENP